MSKAKLGRNPFGAPKAPAKTRTAPQAEHATETKTASPRRAVENHPSETSAGTHGFADWMTTLAAGAIVLGIKTIALAAGTLLPLNTSAKSKA